ncbi:multidrug effflux MFS transporter, partial [Paraburkholderia aspalathi]|nr:multidrug effflux MFS transporter [Paraburkholderia aspalathi]
FIIRETVVPDRRQMQPKRLLQSYTTLLKSKYFMFASFAIGGTTGALYASAAILPFILMERVGMSATAFGVGLLLQTASFVTGGLLFRVAMKHYPVKNLATLGFVAISLASVLMAVSLQIFEPSYLLVMAPMGLYAFGIALVMPQMMSAAMAPFPKIAGAASALMGFFQMAGGLVGGAIASLMSDPVFAMATIIPSMGLIALVSFGLWRRLPEPAFHFKI